MDQTACAVDRTPGRVLCCWFGSGSPRDQTLETSVVKWRAPPLPSSGSQIAARCCSGARSQSPRDRSDFQLAHFSLLPNLPRVRTRPRIALCCARTSASTDVNGGIKRRTGVWASAPADGRHESESEHRERGPAQPGLAVVGRHGERHGGDAGCGSGSKRTAPEQAGPLAGRLDRPARGPVSLRELFSDPLAAC